MGIHRLMYLLNEKAPGCIKNKGIKIYEGRAVACDATLVNINL
jgi:hypothetical protein